MALLPRKEQNKTPLHPVYVLYPQLFPSQCVTFNRCLENYSLPPCSHYQSFPRSCQSIVIIVRITPAPLLQHSPLFFRWNGTSGHRSHNSRLCSHTDPYSISDCNLGFCHCQGRVALDSGDLGTPRLQHAASSPQIFPHFLNRRRRSTRSSRPRSTPHMASCLLRQI